jgi:predicted regulator of amino acid metabolism with ACT domain
MNAMSSDDRSAASSNSTEKSAVSLSEAVHSTSFEIITTAASDPALTEDLALVLLKRSDLPAQVLDQLSKNGGVMKSRKVKLAVVEHPRTPRHVSIPMVRHLFTFDLMQVALTPVVPADIKMVAEESLINRLERLPQGQRLSLAHRASGRVAAELLHDPEPRVIHAALENSRLTETAVIEALMRQDAPAALVAAVCQDSKWSARREIRMVLLRNESTSPAWALEFARSLPAGLVREILQDSRLPAITKESLLRLLSAGH